MSSPTRLWAIASVAVLVVTGPLANHFGIAERLLLATLISWMLACAGYALMEARSVPSEGRAAAAET